MGLMDKVKAQANQLAHEGKAKLDQAQANRRSDALLRQLGAAVYADRTDRGTPDTQAKIDQLISDISAHERENGLNLAAPQPNGPQSSNPQPNAPQPNAPQPNVPQQPGSGPDNPFPGPAGSAYPPAGSSEDAGQVFPPPGGGPDSGSSFPPPGTQFFPPPGDADSESGGPSGT